MGRGNPIDETVLCAALQAGRLRAACLDVYEREPLPLTSPLRHCRNVLLMPHASAFSPNYMDLFVCEYIRLFRRLECMLSSEAVE